MSRYSLPLAAIFWSHVDVDGPISEVMGTSCWMWTATTNGGGCEQFDVSQAYGGGHIRAHRFAWELFNGPIPDGPSHRPRVPPNAAPVTRQLYLCQRCTGELRGMLAALAGEVLPNGHRAQCAGQ